jgi:carboxypeptidase Taq
MSFAKLDELCRIHSAIDHAQSILGADEATHMAPGGGEERAAAMGRLAAMSHEMLTSPQVGDWIAAARQESLDAERQAAVREFARVHANMTALTSQFVERQTNARMRCEQLWRKLRPKGDWKSFEPALAELVALAREEAALRGAALGLDPYDALIEQHDPGSRAGEIEKIFAELKGFLVGFVPKAEEIGGSRRIPNGVREYAVGAQRELGIELMRAVGFDFEHGSLSVSVHPFCGGVPSDVRITTRYRGDDFLSALMGVLHETGHALYEQNLPGKWRHWPSGRARGMAMHESQSLFSEKQVGRNPAFWRFALPIVRERLGVDWSLEDILAAVLAVKRGLIRVDADEVTYPLHVILRFELECELISGRLAVADIPEAWDEKMKTNFGLSTIDNPKDGPMQDVHWAAGIFGYFPSYTLGALLAAQQWQAVHRAMPDIDSDIAAGRFDRINDWRRENIWSKASIHSADEITHAATGSSLSAQPFIEHLKARYGA